MAARKGNSIIVKTLLTLQSRGVDPAEMFEGKNALYEALSFYSISNFETAELILLHVAPTIEILLMVANFGYLEYFKLLLNDCRLFLTSEQVDTITSIINARYFFPKFQQASILQSLISAREVKKEVLILLRKDCVFSRAVLALS
jgi:hypothetical protein